MKPSSLLTHYLCLFLILTVYSAFNISTKEETQHYVSITLTAISGALFLFLLFRPYLVKNALLGNTCLYIAISVLLILVVILASDIHLYSGLKGAPGNSTNGVNGEANSDENDGKKKWNNDLNIFMLVLLCLCLLYIIIQKITNRLYGEKLTLPEPNLTLTLPEPNLTLKLPEPNLTFFYFMCSILLGIFFITKLRHFVVQHQRYTQQVVLIVLIVLIILAGFSAADSAAD